jgi:hypothetical protein
LYWWRLFALDTSDPLHLIDLVLVFRGAQIWDIRNWCEFQGHRIPREAPTKWNIFKERGLCIFRTSSLEKPLWNKYWLLRYEV